MFVPDRTYHGKITVLNVKPALKYQKQLSFSQAFSQFGRSAKNGVKNREKRGVGRRAKDLFLFRSFLAPSPSPFSARHFSRSALVNKIHLRLGQFFSSLLSPQSFSWSHLRTASIQFPLSHEKSEDPQVAETVAERENILITYSIFDSKLQGTFGRGPDS